MHYVVVVAVHVRCNAIACCDIQYDSLFMTLMHNTLGPPRRTTPVVIAKHPITNNVVKSRVRLRCQLGCNVSTVSDRLCKTALLYTDII